MNTTEKWNDTQGNTPACGYPYSVINSEIKPSNSVFGEGVRD